MPQGITRLYLPLSLPGPFRVSDITGETPPECLPAREPHSAIGGLHRALTELSQSAPCVPEPSWPQKETLGMSGLVPQGRAESQSRRLWVQLQGGTYT